MRTLGPALKALRARFDIGRVVLVADARMRSQDNLDLLASQGWDWVVAARLRSLPRRMEAALFASHDWVTVSEDTSVTERQLKGRRLVLRHSKKQAAKDAYERDCIVEKRKRRLKQASRDAANAAAFSRWTAMPWCWTRMPSTETHALTGSTAFGPAWIATIIQHIISMHTTGSGGASKRAFACASTPWRLSLIHI